MINSELEKAVFTLIRNNPGVIRSEVARRTGVSKSTGERISRALIEQELVTENSDITKRKGRGGIGLYMNPKGPCVIGTEFSVDKKILCALLDLDGKVIAECSDPVSEEMNKKQIMMIIEKCIGKMQKFAQKKKRKILGIGYGDPGVIDTQSGTSLFSSTFPEWKNVKITERLQKHFKLPVFVQDSPRIKCMAEARNGVAKGVANFILIDFAAGIGLGVYNGKRPYTGGQGYGCEMGHMVVEPDGPLCGCGGKGCLEALVSTNAIIAQSATAVKNGVQTSIAQKAGNNINQITIYNVFDAARENDRFAVGLMDSVIRILGTTIGNVCNLFNPSLVVLGGKMAEYPELWKPIENVIRRSAMPFIANCFDVKFSALSEQNGVLGAGELVVERMLYGSN